MIAGSMIDGGTPPRALPFAGPTPRRRPGPNPDGPGLQYLRASGLAQTRLQLAVLSGNRRRALREIDRLVEIDRQLETIARTGEADGTFLSPDDMAAHLRSQQHAIASEKLALTAAVRLPTVALPDGLQAQGAVMDLGDFDIVEDESVGPTLVRLALWLAAAVVLVGALAIAVPLLAAG